MPQVAIVLKFYSFFFCFVCNDNYLTHSYLYLYKFEKGFLATSFHVPSLSQFHFFSILYFIYFIKYIMSMFSSNNNAMPNNNTPLT
mgnify:CR=1 FL=1